MVFVICCVILAGLQVASVPLVQAATDNQYIRVGLDSQYKNRSKITLKTTQIGLGYSSNNIYTEELKLISNSGFSFTPATGYYFSVDKTYTSYSQAKKVANTMEQLDINAYPTITYRGLWKVYIGGSTDKSKVQIQLEKVTNRFGFTYSKIMGDNQYRVLLAGKQDFILIDIDSHKTYPQFTDKSYQAGGAILDLGSSQYRGRIEIGRYKSNSLTAINIVNIEQYLYGVVPSEMFSAWPIEALKAQAVCARGYAVMKAGLRSDSNLVNPYRMNDTTASQVYKGYTIETKATNQAVNETKGETVCYNNKIVSTYYSSTSGGSTENIEDMWSIAAPYLRSVPDLYESEPAMKPWVFSMTKAQINTKLLNRGYNIGNVLTMIPEIRTSSGRVYSLKIKGTNKNIVLQTGTISSTLSLPSTKFKIIQYGDKPDKVVIKGKNSEKSKQISQSYVIDGNYQIKKSSQTIEQYIVLSVDNRTNYPRKAPTSQDTLYLAGQGFGHGVGMSQSGAKGMAEAGYNYEEILKHYFKGTEVR